MFHKISPWVVLLSAVSGTWATPVSPNGYKQNAKADLVNRQFECPPGVECGHGPVCATIFCDLPACVDAPACQNVTSKRSEASSLADRQFDCPPGIECGPGPECTSATCDLPGCADADVCQDDQNKKRSEATTLVGRQFGCPAGSDCGHGPECTLELCDLPGCADADVCQSDKERKRSATTDAVRPVCDLCIVGEDGTPVCGCATTSEGHKRRASEKRCPLYCITTEEGEFLCGCAAQDYENSIHGGDSKA